MLSQSARLWSSQPPLVLSLDVLNGFIVFSSKVFAPELRGNWPDRMMWPLLKQNMIFSDLVVINSYKYSNQIKVNLIGAAVEGIESNSHKKKKKAFWEAYSLPLLFHVGCYLDALCKISTLQSIPSSQLNMQHACMPKVFLIAT